MSSPCLSTNVGPEQERMKPPVLRVPTRGAHDADHMAIIAVAGGIYLWWGRTGLPAATAPWIVGIAVASILCGVLGQATFIQPLAPTAPEFFMLYQN